MAKRKIAKFVKYLLLPALGCCLITLIVIDQWSRYRFGASAYQMAGRHLPREIAWQKEQRPSLKPVLLIIEKLIPADDRYNFHPIEAAGAPLWSEQWTSNLAGPSTNFHSQPVKQDLLGRPAPATRSELLNKAFYPGNDIRVNSPETFKKALKNIRPGDTLTLAPGVYSFHGRSISPRASGEKLAPIRIRAERLGEVRLQFDLLEGFHITSPHWIFENLEIEGVCKKTWRCEHAFHIVGAARNVTLRNLFIKNFNSHIKVNGSKAGFYPDGGLIEYSMLINDQPRPTSNPVSPIDIVAVNDWIVRKSVVADFAKAQGDKISYAGFFKGGARNNLFEQNLVLCQLRHQGGVRLGLSLGGGGTSVNASRGKDNSIESLGGILKRNVIANCPLDVGIYLNRSTDSHLSENLLVNTTGIHVRFRESDAVILANQLDGDIVDRDGGQHQATDNVEASIQEFRYPASLQDSAVRAVLAGDLASPRAPNRYLFHSK